MSKNIIYRPIPFIPVTLKPVAQLKFKTYKVIGKIELKRVGGNKWFYETKNLRFSAISKDLSEAFYSEE